MLGSIEAVKSNPTSVGGTLGGLRSAALVLTLCASFEPTAGPGSLGPWVLGLWVSLLG